MSADRHSPLAGVYPAGQCARLLITKACTRHCPGCCNTYPAIMAQIQTIASLTEITGFAECCITGGEPMLIPERVSAVVAELRARNPESHIYLYTALYRPEIKNLLPLLDGIHFTLHAGANRVDQRGFAAFQQLLRYHAGSFRLYIDPRVTRPVVIYPYVWTRVEVKPWLTEEQLLALQPGGLPPGEQLFYLPPDSSSSTRT